ncbi:hypothetical protein CIHG_03535 [Coccidioides immitis H538.4]|uniref:Uncharacterized protein n=3 Tax=Coccidioides immitis TaxID=5501 RepID=A0A0J8TPQ6_COCIT|nr:hypothetical protein CIRG_08884 [Coccidioides immitis RMSCC 2394]KMU75697.1 hypothetical protein CISG_04871 [Coccidioides immitis RMSCC 3703]KMU86005.1 hypothetical protein CIHG_03535 [Coccidioides immitis H538.4]
MSSSAFIIPSPYVSAIPNSHRMIPTKLRFKEAQGCYAPITSLALRHMRAIRTACPGAPCHISYAPQIREPEMQRNQKIGVLPRRLLKQSKDGSGGIDDAFVRNKGVECTCTFPMLWESDPEEHEQSWPMRPYTVLFMLGLQSGRVIPRFC